MVNITTSIDADLFAKAQSKGIGWSKALKIGIELCLNDGVDTLDNLREELKIKKEALELKTVAAKEFHKALKESKNKYVRKCMEISFPELHKRLLNKEVPELDIDEIRAKTGEKIGLSELMDAYDNENLMDVEIKNIREGIPEE